MTANTLAKLAHGQADNLLTSVARAWLPSKPVILAPAMNTQMWLHPTTQEHLDTLRTRGPGVIVHPQTKKLACGDTGIGAMAKIEDIVNAVRSRA